MKKAFKSAFPCTIPVLTGYMFLGIAFGLLMRTRGFSVWQPVVMSLLIFSGALEFAAVPVMLQPFAPVSSFVLGLMLSIRHLFYGIPMLSKYRDAGKLKPVLIAGLTDESFSLLSATPVPEGIQPRHFYAAVCILCYSYWCCGTALGAIAGDFLPFDLTGLDFALTALFIVLFVEQVKTKSGKISGAMGLAASLAALLLTGPSRMVPFSMAAIVVLLLAGRRVMDNE